MKRRNLVQGMAAAGVLAALPGRACSGPQARGGGALKILFMGGTGFIGPHMVQALLDQGHQLTLFNRGKSNPGIFGDLELIKGDRFTDDIQQLAGREWDVVIDTAAYVPRAVNSLLATLKLATLKQYLFISTISVYEDFSKPGISETSPTATMPDSSSEDVNQYYGALKVLCEQAAEASLPGRVTSVRCGMIVGPGDHTDRFTYYPERAFRGGDMLAPGAPADPIQTLDVRDLADWVAHCVAQRIVGTFNATSAVGQQSFGEVLELSKRLLNPAVKLHWVPSDFLLEQGLQQMQDLPFWVDPAGSLGGVWRVDTRKAIAAGLQTGALANTIGDTHAWYQAQPAKRREALRAGLSMPREEEVLLAWSEAYSGD